MEFVKIEDLISYQIKGLWGEEFDDSFHCTPVIKTNNMNYDGTIDLNNLTYRNIKHDSILENYLQKGDLLIEKSGGTKTHSVGYVTYFDGEEKKYVCNNFILGLRPDTTKINSKYLFYNLKYMYENGKFSDCYNKTTGIQNLKVKFYLVKKIKLREFSKQNEIIEVLDIITKQINSLKIVLENFDNIVKSQFIEMFGNIKEDKYVEIVECGKIGTGTTPSMKVEEYYENADICFIKPGDLSDYVVKLNDSECKIDFRAKNKARIFPRGTVLVCCIASIGKIGIVESEIASCNQQINYIIPNENVNSVYLANAIYNNKNELINMANAPVVPIINKTQFEKFRIPLANIELQHKFADFVQQIDKSKFIVQKQIKLLEELLEKKMNEYFGN